MTDKNWGVWNGDDGTFLEIFDTRDEAIAYAEADHDDADYYEVGRFAENGIEVTDIENITPNGKVGP